jgi:hypothetical protein
VLYHVSALLRSHLAPLPAQFLAPLRRHLPKPLVGFANLFLPLRRQTSELLPTLTYQLPLFGRHRTPLRKPLLCATALFRRHRDPPGAASCQRLLPVGGQAIPLALIALQHFLLFRR